MAKKVSILGSTGSIGRNTLRVVDNLREWMDVRYLTAGRNAELLIEQAREYHPEAVAIVELSAAVRVEKALSGSGIEVLPGREGVIDIASRDDVDVVLNGLVGSAGMEPTVRAVEAGVNVALSNKESLVMAGRIINEIKRETGAEIYPVDSEHSAIWQCLAGEELDRVKRIILTGSGGPFRTTPVEEFSAISIDDALKHPNWNMGSKITIDSATLMNKGLEVIEAHWLFGLQKDQIDVVIHPQSVIHSMVQFVDGSIKAQLGLPDMKIPIQYALTYPNRSPAPWEEVSFPAIERLTFEEPNLGKFPCLRLAYEALERGGSAPAALNVTNDNTVRAFLEGHISFIQIPEINEMAMAAHDWEEYPDLDYLLRLERWGKNFVEVQMAKGVTP